jgi:hypothetical protein
MAMTVERSVNGRRPARGHPTTASDRNPDRYSPITTAAAPASSSRSTRTTAAVNAAAVGPNAASARPARPPGRSRPQLSRSMVRTIAARAAATATAHGVHAPTSVRTMPATKNAPIPSSAIASAVAFHVETNEPSAVAERTTGTRRRKPDGGERGSGTRW